MKPPTITPLLVAELLVDGERWPVYVHVIDHPDGRVLVDTGMTELHPAVADFDPRLVPLSAQAFDLANVDVVVNTHLHFDHCGGNHLFAGKPIYVQRQELDDARREDDYTIRKWVEAPGVRYEPVDGELELLPGLRLVPAPGHARGLQVVVVETGGRPVVVGGDVAVRLGELDEPGTEGQQRVRALEPELVWLANPGGHNESSPRRTRFARGVRVAVRQCSRMTPEIRTWFALQLGSRVCSGARSRSKLWNLVHTPNQVPGTWPGRVFGNVTRRNGAGRATAG